MKNNAFFCCKKVTKILRYRLSSLILADFAKDAIKISKIALDIPKIHAKLHFVAKV
jgi:hypothetical protein